jgi:hypothetical protein
MIQRKKKQSDMLSAHHQPSSLTGRDGYIMTQALAYASEWLKTLPIQWDEPSNRSDMDAILEDMSSPPFAKMLRWQAKCKLAKQTLQSPDVMIVKVSGSIAQEVA